MDPLLHQLTVFAHILGAVFLTGYALFWSLFVLGARAEGERGDSLRGVMARAAWPPPPIPSPVRLSVTGIGWASLIAMIATGLLVYVTDSSAGLVSSEGAALSPFGAKLMLVGLLFVIPAVARRSTRPIWMHLFLIVNLAILALSAIIAR